MTQFYLKYGSYQHALDEARVSTQRHGIFVNGMSKGYLETWTIDGMLFAADPPSLTTAMNAMRNAYANQAQDLGFFQDDNSATTLSLLSSTCLGGTRVVQPPFFPDLRGASYTTYIPYSIVIEGEVFDPACTILAWFDTITFIGGGPRTVFLETCNGPPQKQLVNQQTVWRATQIGNAVGFLTRPFPAFPFAPDAYRGDLSSTAPSGPAQRSGPPSQPVYSEFGISWNYVFESAEPLVGSPTASPI